MTDLRAAASAEPTDVAIIGMSGRFPGAATLEEFWRNLRAGVESISFFSEEELIAGGVEPGSLRDPRYVPARGVLHEAEWFDAGFFGLSPREAAVTDPQHRIFLECCWEALEGAGYDSSRARETIGVFAGAATNHYAEQIRSDPELRRLLGDVQVGIGSEVDFLANRVSYKLGLRGPSVAVQSACSTSLVAVHLACLNLLHHECDIALAGAVSVRFPQICGYRYEEGGILSPDGHCRAFDARARGAVGGNGAGVVVLKRLEDALADRDWIRAVIKGSALNNDGSHKVGYTAPSVEAQAEVIAAAHAAADVDPRTIGYVEAHGTGTPLGDPIEVAALTRAFAAAGAATGCCALGSVKTNIGHLNTAAGIAGLIKTVLALEHRELPPSLHFERGNPEIDFATSPFQVNAELREWKSDGAPLRAGVSSFGMGGTNAHVVLEEAPARDATAPARPDQLLLLSARTEAALARSTESLARHLGREPVPQLADAAYTLQVGRRGFAHRRMLVCNDRGEALEKLAAGELESSALEATAASAPSVAFLLPGLGDHYLGMGRDLYRDEPAFRSHVDRCAEILVSRRQFDPREMLLAEPGEGGPPGVRQGGAGGELDLRRMLRAEPEPEGPLARPERSHPAVFVLDYALARTLLEWGIRPDLMLGHSLGELVAACLAGVFSLEDALELVAGRAELIASTPTGAMLAVPRSPAEVEELLGEELSLSIVNGPSLCVLSGSSQAIGELEERLAAQGVICRRVRNAHRIHSRFMEPIARPLAGLVEGLRLAPPEIPFLSNVTGRCITEAEATDPAYWVRHLCRPARFERGIETVWRSAPALLLEVGPGQTLGSLAWQHPARRTVADPVVLPTLRAAYDGRQGDLALLLTTLGRFWLRGGQVDWDAFDARERRSRVPLPTHPFERTRYWVESAGRVEAAPTVSAAPERPASPIADAPAGEPTTRVRIRGIWQELLAVDSIGSDANFLELGGHSLLAIQLAARLMESFRVELSLRSLLDAPTLDGQAQLVERLQAERRGRQDDAPRTPPALAPAPRDAHRPFPLTDVQQAYWVGRSAGLELGEVAAHGYVELDCAELDLDRLATACRRLVERHGMLRAVVTADGEQRILSSVPPFEIEVDDLRGRSAREQEEELARKRESLSHRVVPPESWPLFRMGATRLDDRRSRLHLNLDLLIGDAWSWWTFFDELARLYRDPRTALPAIGVSFRDYVLAERAQRDSPEYARAREYWEARVPDLPPPPELPLARRSGPPETDRARFARHEGRLDCETWSRLTTRARRSGLTPSGLLLAAFSEVLAVWSRSPRFTLNLTLFDRLPVHPDVDGLFGDFTSLTLLAVDHSREETFGERARRLQERLWDDLDHRAYSGVRVLRELAREERRLSAGLMPVVFTSTLGLGLSGKAAAPLAGIGEVVHAITQTPHVWLDHQVCEEAGELVFNWDVVEGLFPEGFVEAMFERYRAHLLRLAEDDASWEAGWSERARFLVPREQIERQEAVNATSAPIPDRTLHSLVLEQVRERQQQRQPAVVSPDASLGFAELGRRAGALAQLLRARGVKPGELVAICMEKSWEQVVAVLGILGAGAAYLPLDPGNPSERLEQMLAQAGGPRVLTQARVDERIRWPAGVERLRVDDLDAAEDAEIRLDPGRPDDLAYVIYTSGSTGTPSGVMIPHRGAVNTVLDVNRRLSLGSGDAVLALSSLGFDLSVYDIFGTLAAGATVVLPEEAQRKDPAHWLALMRRHEVTVWNSVPALMSLLVEFLEQRSETLPESLRWVLLSGDWIPVTLPDRIRALGRARVLSLGGATEASIWSVLHPVERVDPAAASIPYGRPLANQRLHVLDAALGPRPVWVPGELYIGGAGLALGYQGDDEKTRERFVSHPRSGERLYRTGDLGRTLPDGNVEFLGREDQQVKVQGHRVELGEIEAALVQHPAVEAAVAAATGEAGAERRLVAYLVAKDGAALDAASLRPFLLGKLPEFMVPTAFACLDALPRTSNGKIDRRRLPPLQHPGAARARPASDEGKDLASRVTRLVTEILGAERIERATDFFSLGASSLDMVRIANAVERAFGVRPRIDDLYAEPSIDGILAGLEQSREPCRVPAEAAAPTLLGDPRALAARYRPIVDPEEREAFKEREPGLRRVPEERPSVALADEGCAGLERLLARRSHRQFALRPVPSGGFGRLLGVLRRISEDGATRYLYPSAGGLYPVQSYLAVKAGRVAGVPQGTYYYDPAEHRLACLRDGVEIDRAAYGPLVNRPVYDEAAFAIFLVAQLDAVAPLYGSHALPFAMIEAGTICQLLMTRAPECGLGLCPIGDLEFARIRPLFELGEGHVLVHSLLGGLVEPKPGRGTEGGDRGGGDSAARRARLLERVQSLSPEEVRDLLAAHRPARDEGGD